jgi:hypothetical protein
VETNPPLQTMQTMISTTGSRSKGHRETWEQFTNCRPPAPRWSTHFCNNTPAPSSHRGNSPSQRFNCRLRRRPGLPPAPATTGVHCAPPLESVAGLHVVRPRPPLQFAAGRPCSPACGTLGRRDSKPVLTQNVHLAPNTQQAEQAGFTRAESHETCQSIFPEN